MSNDNKPAAAQEAAAIDADVFHAMNGELCDFAIRWKLDGDYLRCTGCKRPQLTNYAGEAFIHAGGCKHADTSEVHPWLALRRIMRPMFAPVAAAPVDGNFGFHWSPEQFAAAIERIAGGALADYEGVAADESFLRNAATLIRRMASTPAAPGIKQKLPCSWCEEGQNECSMCKDGSND